MKNLFALLMILPLAACSSTTEPADMAPLQFYDWINFKLVAYNECLNQMNYLGQERISGEISIQVQRRFDMLAADLAKEPDPDRRFLATFALGFSRRPEAVAFLTPMLSDPDSKVRGTAAAAIAYLNPPDAPLDKIAALLTDPSKYARHGALVALKGLLKPTQETPYYKRIVEFLDDQDEGLRAEAVQVLSKLRRADSIVVLVRKALVDPSALVRINACMAIGGMGGDAGEAVPHLIERLRDTEAGVIEAVYWALKKITNREDADRSYHNWREWYDEHVKLFEYACPKHPEVVREVGGACPQCGTRLELRYKIDPTVEYYCPRDAGVVAPTPGKCAKCRGDLVPRKKIEKPEK